jgi:hypothetical protein
MLLDRLGPTSALYPRHKISLQPPWRQDHRRTGRHYDVESLPEIPFHRPWSEKMSSCIEVYGISVLGHLNPLDHSTMTITCCQVSLTSSHLDVLTSLHHT